MLKQSVQTALRVIFPPSCVGCGCQVESDFGLCGSCWRDLPLIHGPVCQSCGVPILAEAGDTSAQCEDCVRTARPWQHGRAAMRYRDLGRNLVLRLKHSDRQDVAVMAATWLAQAGRPLIREDTVLVPVPLHWSRLVKRRYNQAALLAQNLALKVDRPAVLDALLRRRRTRPLDGVGVEERFQRMRGAIAPNPLRMQRLEGKSVLLIDDVMTSGATLASAAEAAYAAGAGRVDVLVLARVCKDD